MVKVSEDMKTGILSLTVESDEPSLSYEINKTIIEQLNEHQKKFNTDIAKQTYFYKQSNFRY